VKVSSRSLKTRQKRVWKAKIHLNKVFLHKRSCRPLEIGVYCTRPRSQFRNVTDRQTDGNARRLACCLRSRSHHHSHSFHALNNNLRKMKLTTGSTLSHHHRKQPDSCCRCIFEIRNHFCRMKTWHQLVHFLKNCLSVVLRVISAKDFKRSQISDIDLRTSESDSE